MKILKGIPVSPGIVIGRVHVLDDARGRRIPLRRIIEDQADPEVDRFEAARGASIGDLGKVHAVAVDEMGEETARIFLFHIGALSDPALIEPIRTMIREEHVGAEYAVAEVFRRWTQRFAAHDDAAFRTKVNDLQDLADRLLVHLQGGGRTSLAHLSEPSIVAARDLTPSQTAGFDREKILAFATDLGGPTSHTAIVARALNLPAVVGCHTITALAEDGGTIIVDGDRGRVILDPDEETIEEYRVLITRSESHILSLREIADLPAVTTDGVTIELVGNIEFPEEAQAVLELGGVGVGLYRTEFLYLTGLTEPSEEDHLRVYKKCIEMLKGRPLTIRTVDLGADKYTQARAEIPERNPFLGLRSIRYCLQHMTMFKTQLRAILRASAHGPIKIMFPLITTLHEFRQARHLLHDAMEDLEELGIEHDSKVPVGMMVEVPSAAVMADAFAREADFFSIGTNDLVQYTLAVDRTNERVASLYQPTHPAVIKLIRDVVRAGKRRGIPVSCCGESAGEPIYAPLLLGLGLRTLSLTASGIPALKQLIRGLSIPQCEAIAKKAISLDSEIEVAAYLRDKVRKIVPEAFEGWADER
ncbi:MAG: phosphoenolpyruvate--protein phosphotransferase [Phycisphaeraceae bacterium]|nr:MAG: phosphoenolpyruvate--protein phosphotransferase [Phycisphaeraceae bacterium]